ncbi:ankyrin repeat domain-containing protein [Paraglaciecola chathamensis]|uniref:ankyrin repeat domain-containing protein n=1 Tax=Paraglaciecola chathamensis TaxID=368405 RepID=UPI0026FE05F5|nr:ankyrin repeat domain-containing protein [Paraglaciecola chathamensis]MDO6838816.1 ankyrin repeat domain-containing protein [Paraglaciecola chathamensis]
MKRIFQLPLQILLTLLFLTTAYTSQADPVDSERLQTVYFDAARQGDVSTLSAYYAAGLSPNVADKKGYTALILSAYHGQTDAVKYLLSHASVNACQEDNSGNTALMGAIFKGNFGAIKALIGADCDIDQSNANGQTAAMFATLFNRTETIAALTDAGADLSAKDSSGNSLIDIALSQGNYELAEALSEKQADK